MFDNDFYYDDSPVEPFLKASLSLTVRNLDVGENCDNYYHKLRHVIVSQRRRLCNLPKLRERVRIKVFRREGIRSIKTIDIFTCQKNIDICTCFMLQFSCLTFKQRSPVSDEQLKKLATWGIITPNTFIVTTLFSNHP